MTRRPIRASCCAAVPSAFSKSNRRKRARRSATIGCLPDRSPLETDLKDIRDLPTHARDDLEQFFRATNALENKELKFLGWHGPSRAAKTIKRLAR
ncbi:MULTISPECIES: inorganic diphosphatase [unclassified Bradyrhizobium]|uniref:inorganic diphosphatase n=1 Tax=Bradyrhizobium sp. USDA 4541 TaxID=2817704 RepID=UPI0035C70EC4